MSINLNNCRTDVYSNASPWPLTRYRVRMQHIATGIAVDTDEHETQEAAHAQAIGALTLALARDAEADGRTDAEESELDLIREWFHWWHTTDGLPTPPDALHVRTAAHLATVRVQAGHKIFGPRDL